MIDLSDLIANRLKEDMTGIKVWGFRKCENGNIKLNSITWPYTLGNINFQIQGYHMDGFLYDIEHEGIVVPVCGKVAPYEEEKNDQYFSSYSPVHEYYVIPRIHCNDKILNTYDEINKKLCQFEKIINNFYVTREEINVAKKYIEKFFYRKEENIK